eukprot:s1514_g4.t1
MTSRATAQRWLAVALFPLTRGTAAKRMQLWLLASILWSALAVESEYHVGVGIADVTGPAAEIWCDYVVMMGYADQDQRDQPGGRLLAEFAADGHQQGQSWPWQTWIVAILFVLICGCGQLLCCFGCLRNGWDRGDFQTLGPYTPISQTDLRLFAGLLVGSYLEEFQADGWAESNGVKPDHEKIGRVLRQEMRLMMLYPVISILAAADSSCEKGMPLWGYALYIPLLLRAKWIEIKILRALNEDRRGFLDWSNIFLAPGFWLGCLEHADWFTDGALPVQAYLCGPSVTERFAESFELSMAWPLAPIVRMLHFWGLLTVDHGWKQAAQETGCLSERALLTSVSKVFLENVAQLWLQASFFALIFGRLHHTGKVKLLISMGLGLISCDSWQGKLSLPPWGSPEPDETTV